jgi:DNA-directed RNA polymerase subunit beta'
MLEVNDFNAIRISLASPEQIRGWSYGEVTKPETINYRTLKPEKDGLFCERIFGPSKDWECYCGKYKRVRYKGIICDKCGVEVARAKVRRERMGHIELASPVSHIWYFKGTPSRMGLLLDISPRNLERILYFALYLVTHVDEDGKQRAIEQTREDEAARIADIEQDLRVDTGDIRAEIERNELARQEELAQTEERLEVERAQRIEELMSGAQELRNDLIQRTGQKAEEKVVLHAYGGKEPILLVKKGAKIGEKVVDEMEVHLEQLLDVVNAELDKEREQVVKPHDEARAREQERLESRMSELRVGVQDQIDAVRAETDLRIQRIESLHKAQLLTEVEYRDLRDQVGSLFEAGMGAEAVQKIIEDIDLDRLAMEMREDIRQSASTSQRRKKATKRLRVVEAFRKSGNLPGWMILTVLPVIPPDLRPMVQLDGGRFATSDLNDLYRRVINRNNRLKRLIELGAPEIIIRNEKRMLQEATDALIDNGRRGRAVAGSGNHKLKSLSDMLKGKQGRFRQNLLGKRVDYSGRSVIVVGPDLKLHQCGLPKRMALELFKPFVMRRLVEKGFAHNIKSAKRVVERVRPEVWDVLEEVIRNHPVLLNRAPTLHRLGIQAFEATLVEGSAIQIHPLVCHAFNADFDGDQMAVHVPLSAAAQDEARKLMMSSRNLLSPASGEPVVNPSKDMVLGCYYLTTEKPNGKGQGIVFSDFEDAILAEELGRIDLHAGIFVRLTFEDGETEVHTPCGTIEVKDLQPLPGSESTRVEPEVAKKPRSKKTTTVTLGGMPNLKTMALPTTAGRIIFNDALRPPFHTAVVESNGNGHHAEEAEPNSRLKYRNELQDKNSLRDVVAEVYSEYGQAITADTADRIKRLGFDYATRSGITLGITDITIPEKKSEILAETDRIIGQIEEEWNDGLITDDEQYRETIAAWTHASEEVEREVSKQMDEFGPIYMMSHSGAAKGGFQQVRQIAGMRGLMADPSGKIIALPIRSNFREGLTVLEYFISTHGARKGLADTALRTAESGYLTRRLIDVAQDVIVREEDCGTVNGLVLRDANPGDALAEPIERRIAGRWTIDAFFDPDTGTEVIGADAAIDIRLSNEIGEIITRNPGSGILVRSPLTCECKAGICRKCYGWSLATGHLVPLGEAVGIIAAQSIGEPGTQLTMRTFHTGGVAGRGGDITQGLPRVEELFEARVPKDQAIIAEVDGVARIERTENGARIVISAADDTSNRLKLPDDYDLTVQSGSAIESGTTIAMPKGSAKSRSKKAQAMAITAPVSGRLFRRGQEVFFAKETPDTREYQTHASARILVQDGQEVTAGLQLTDGALNPQDILRVQGRQAVQMYLVDEVQRVYRSQGVTINDKHIETIVRQMLRKVRVDSQGDTDMLPGELVDRFEYEIRNARVLAEGGEPATATPVLLGVTKASLTTESFLAAASFQETTKVLTDAAIGGQVDRLVGLKENVIIGKLIPAGTGLLARQQKRERLASGDLSDGLLTRQPVVEGDDVSLGVFEDAGEMQEAEIQAEPDTEKDLIHGEDPADYVTDGASIAE